MDDNWQTILKEAWSCHLNHFNVCDHQLYLRNGWS